jgi:hypothetical protein
MFIKPNLELAYFSGVGIYDDPLTGLTEKDSINK